MSELNNKEIVIAVIGFLGILATALFSNWDKLFPKENEIKVMYSGYRPTGVFETELRVFFDVSGTRALLENMMNQILQVQKIQTLQEYPEDSEKINIFFKTIKEESVTLDEVIKALLPAYQNYFSIEELQELNRFYSTEIMQNMIRKNASLAIEAAPIQAQILENYQNRLGNALETKYIEHRNDS